MKKIIFFFSIVFLIGCSNASQAPTIGNGTRDNAPVVLNPTATGEKTIENAYVLVDYSNANNGYIMIRYMGSGSKVKLQLTTPSDITYSYHLGQSDFDVFPITGGDGTYKIEVLENVSDNKYSLAFSDSITVTLSDQFLPYLYPNQYVWFDENSKAISYAEELVESADSDLNAIEYIYDDIISTISYDDEKAKTVTAGYLPNIDDTLDSKKGICFDYASLMAAMMRSQNIPTRLEVGYAGEAYHAWISAYVDEIGWIDNIIEFDGKNWTLMDPTFGASSSNESVAEFIGDGDNYLLKYSY